MKIQYQTVRIKFYYRLTKFLTNKTQKFIIHNFIDQTSVKDLVESFNIPHTEVDVILVNGKSVDFDYMIKNDDRIEVFPDRALCSTKKIIPLKSLIKGKPKFIADVHLGKLVREMRKLGLDVIYNNQFSDDEIVEISYKERRIILTRDIGLLKRKKVKYGLYLLNEKTNQQLKEIFQNTKIKTSVNPLSICLECGTKLKRMSKKKALEQLNHFWFEKETLFYHCGKCKKIYWQGSHYKRMMKSIKKEISILSKFIKK